MFFYKGIFEQKSVPFSWNYCIFQPMDVQNQPSSFSIYPFKIIEVTTDTIFQTFGLTYIYYSPFLIEIFINTRLARQSRDTAGRPARRARSPAVG